MATAMSTTVSTPVPATAVEVVTSLGGSIVAVDTLWSAPVQRHRGWATLGAGLALISLALAMFFYSVRAADHNAAARAQWIADKRPAWAFRPTQAPVGVGLTTGIAALAGIALVVTGLVRRRDRNRTHLRVGQHHGVDIVLADAPHDRTLVDHGSAGFIAPIDGLEGDAAFAGTSTTLAAMRAAGHVAVPLYVGTQVRTTIGRTSFFVRGMEAPARSAPPMWALEQAPLTFLAASAIAHFAVWGLMRSASDDMMSASTDQSLTEDVSMRAISLSQEDVPPPPPEVGDASDSGTPGAASPTAVALETGTLGRNEANPNPAHLQIANRDLSPRMSREQAIDMAIRAGVLGSDVFVGPIAVANAATIASGMDDLDITGGFYDGGGTGAPSGSFGWGIKGSGNGCGNIAGVPCSGIASDPFATNGNDGSDRYRGPLGDGGNGLRTHTSPPPIVKPSNPIACSADEPCLDREIIRRYVHRNIDKISYCYEKELLATPGLNGTVVANFTLNGNGTVIASSAAGVSPEVSSCVANVISHIAFPKVGGLGAYPIKYPFSMHPRG
jgi:hypothetical protein